ncbi:MAG TPA: DUF2723 domain-containing protein [Candidatus Polarisedimenticolaceae bacterium]|nr:DUF2723 domain-containing protein [Candidatus Polarisedimenticolaceae bacterium]
MVRRDGSRPYATGLGCASAVVLLYVWTACPTVYYGDGGELIAAADSLGVAHPPGYPLYTALAKVALAVPLGEAAWRVNLMSSVFGALAAGLVAVLVARWTGSALAALAAGAALAVTRDVWAIATVAEVYTLHLFLVTALLVVADEWHGAVDRRARRRWTWVAAALVGVGLAHRPTVLLALPALVVLAWDGGPRQPIGRRCVAGATGLAAAIPVAAYTWLMWRSSLEPAVNWAAPDHPLALWNHVTTRGYRLYVLGPAGWLELAGWRRLIAMLWSGAGYVGLPLAIAGLAARFASRGSRDRPALAGLTLGGAWAGFGLMYGTEDVEVLFLPCAVAAALGAGLGLPLLSGAIPRALRPVPAIVLVLAPWALNHPSADLRRATGARDYGRDVLATVPPAGVLFVEGDNAFVLAYLQQVLGERRDVTIYDRNGLMFHDLLDEPGSPPGPDESPLGFRVRREIEYLTAAVGERPVQFLVWPGYELPRGFRFEPEGLSYRVLPPGHPRLDTAGTWGGYHEESVIAEARRTDNPFARTVAASYPLMRGERARFDGDRPAALRWFERATDLARSETIHNYLGTVFGRLGELERAKREFRRAIAAKPVSVRAWNNLGRAESLSGNPAAARQAWRRSLAIEPDQPETRRLLGSD